MLQLLVNHNRENYTGEQCRGRSLAGTVWAPRAPDETVLTRRRDDEIARTEREHNRRRINRGSQGTPQKLAAVADTALTRPLELLCDDLVLHCFRFNHRLPNLVTIYRI